MSSPSGNSHSRFESTRARSKCRLQTAAWFRLPSFFYCRPQQQDYECDTCNAILHLNCWGVASSPDFPRDRMTAIFGDIVLTFPVTSARTSLSAAVGGWTVSCLRLHDYTRNPPAGLRLPGTQTQPRCSWPLSACSVSTWLRVAAIFLSLAALSVYTEHRSSGKSSWRSDTSTHPNRPHVPPFPSPLLFAEARATASKSQDYYSILGVKRNATTSEIKKAYRKLARQYHPDASEGNKDKFLRIAKAHEVLGDEQQRKMYDLHGEAGLNAAGGSPDTETGGVQFDFSDFFGTAFGGDGTGGSGTKFKFTFTTGDGAHEGFPGGFGNFFPKGAGVREESSDESLYENEEDVLELGPQGLQRQLDSREFVFLLNLYDPRCRPCRQLKTEYVKAAKKFRGIVPFGAVNCNRFKNMRLCREAGHYPSLLLYPPDLRGKPVEHRGDRSAESLVRFLSDGMPSAATVLTSFNFEQWISERPELPKVVLFTDKKGVSPLFKYISYHMRKQLAFGVVPKEQAKLINAFRDSLRGQRQRETGGHRSGKRLPSDIIFPSMLAIDDIDSLTGEWINVHGHVDQELLTLTLSRVAAKARASSGATFRELTARRMASGECSPEDSQFCFILLVPDELASRGEPAALFATLHTLAEKFRRDPLKLCWVNENSQILFAAAFGVSAGSGLTFVAYRPKRRKYEVLQKEISTTSLEAFIDNVISGGKQLTKKILRTPVLVAPSGARARVHDEL